MATRQCKEYRNADKAFERWLDEQLPEYKAGAIKSILHNNTEKAKLVKKAVLSFHRLVHHSVLPLHDLKHMLGSLIDMTSRRICGEEQGALEVYLDVRLEADRNFCMPGKVVYFLHELLDYGDQWVRKSALMLLTTVKKPQESGLEIDTLVPAIELGSVYAVMVIRKIFESYDSSRAETAVRSYIDRTGISSPAVDHLLEKMISMHKSVTVMNEAGLDPEGLERLSRSHGRHVKLPMVHKYRYLSNLFSCPDVERLSRLFLKPTQLELYATELPHPFVMRLKKIRH